ncbi:MAG: site-2 protease family protein [Planctomycetota bacterium]
MNELLNPLLILAASEEPSFLVSLGLDVWLWTKVALGIGLVIFVHELGHFLAAKTFGVKCEKFYVGFDVPIQLGPIKLPRTLGKFTYGETEYGIGILPLGGYVKMLGQDDDPRKAEQEAERIRLEGGQPDEEPKLDPRSYPAKPVWQRMVIISAGVVVNVITGIMFAAIAFRFGVPYTPAIVGKATPGGPAWQAGIEPGGQILSVGGLDDGQMHFKEMQMTVLTLGLDSPDEPVPVSIRYGNQIRKYEINTKASPLNPDRRLIGINSASDARLHGPLVAVPGTAADSVLTKEDAKSEIIEVDGKSIDLAADVPAVPLLQAIYGRPAAPIELTLRNSDQTERTVVLPPQAARSFGVSFAIGKITALIDGGPAEQAGLKVGDVILAANDVPVDAYHFALSPTQPGESINLTVRRGEGEQAKELSLSVTASDTLSANAPVSVIASTIASNSLGLAYQPTTTVLTADEATGLKPGDVIQEVRVVLDDKTKEKLSDVLSDRGIEQLSEGWEFNAKQTLSSFMDSVQLLPIGTEVQLKATRPPEGEVIEVTATVQNEERYWYERGLQLAPVSRTQTAASVGEAINLGIREGQRRLADVGGFLYMLVRGKVKAKYVGGPIAIVGMAGAEAEKGISKQLLFLTFLSMNLAILNFLPIPALDGGHMMFLTAELVRGKKMDEQLEMKLTLAGVLALLALMVFVFSNDIVRNLMAG